MGDRIDPETHRRVMGLAESLTARRVPGILGMVPAYASLTIHYDPLQLAGPPVAGPREISPYQRLCDLVAELIESLEETSLTEGRNIEIPVCYGGELGPDLAYVAGHCGVSVEEIIALHSEAGYLVYMIGFSPGFPYLGGLPRPLETPRRPTPRPRVPAGSVGIGGAQTGIYPIESPGGWQLIGRTPLRLFYPEEDPPVLLRAGDRVQFRSISREEFEDAVGQG